MSESERERETPREEKQIREDVEKGTRDPDSIRGSGAPASGNPGPGTEAGKYED
jgi:hypothetical protein